MHIGIAGVVGHRLGLDAAPGGRADDLARLRLNVAEAGFPRPVAVGLRRKLQHHFAGVDVGVDLRHADGGALVRHETVELAELFDLDLGVPGDALAAIADLAHQRAKGGEALVDIGVVALDDGHVRRRLAGDQIDLAALPVLNAKGLRQFGR